MNHVISIGYFITFLMVLPGYLFGTLVASLEERMTAK